MYAVAGESPTDRDLVVSSPDGEHPVRITGAGGDDTDPAIDASGGRVAFTRTTPAGVDVYVVKTDGSGLTQLTTSPGRDIQPSWSPDGTRIAFASERDGDFGLWVMNADGTDQVRLTDGNRAQPELVARRYPDRLQLPVTRLGLRHLGGERRRDVAAAADDGARRRDVPGLGERPGRSRTRSPARSTR